MNENNILSENWKHPYDDRITLIIHEIRSSDRVLDVGCVHEADAFSKRPDWLHRYLCEKAGFVLGIDIDEVEVKKLVRAGFNVRAMNAETMTFNEKFDVVVAGEIIEHLSNPGKFLDRVRECLASKESKFILSTPNLWSWNNLLRGLTGHIPVFGEHTCWFDATTLTQLLKRHGFKFEKIIYVKAVRRTRAWRISHLLHSLGLKKFAPTLLFICKLS